MVKTVALIFGIVYTLVGILGFFPQFGGTIGQAPSVLLGIAPVNLLHNIVHLIIGFAGLGASTDWARSKMFCQWAGVLLIVLGVVGFVAPTGFGFVPLAGGDIWIHLVSGLILAFVGFSAGETART
jgi:hypothetical protein